MKAETSLPASGTARRSVVVIANDALTIRIVRAVFRSAEKSVDCLSSCELGGVDLAVALLAAADDPRQMALIHMSLDGADLEMAHQLRLRGFNGPIIALTNEENHNAYIEAGVDGFLRTPVQPHALLALVEKHL